jgi:hypothetical protein
MLSALPPWLLLPAALLLAAPVFAAESAYDKAAAGARARYTYNAAKCRNLDPAPRASCIKLAKAGAYAALNKTYSDAISAARTTYARTTARCKALPGAERRRCLRVARSEREMALGKAEEIRSAPLAMGPTG